MKTWLRCVFALCLAAGPIASAQTTVPPIKEASISMPYSELKAILDQNKPQVATPPVDYVFSPAKVTVTADQKNARLVADVQVTLLNAKWLLIPVGPAAGVLTVTVDGEPAPVISTGGTLSALIDGQKKKSIALQITREQPVATDGPAARIDLALPPAPLAEVAMTIAAGNQDAKATGGAAVKVTTDKDKTTLAGSFTGNIPASITWQPKPAPGTLQPTRVTATVLTCVEVDRGIIQYRTDLEYRVAGSSVDQFRIALPEGIEFEKAAGPDVASTDLTGEGKDRILTVHLNKSVRGACNLQIAYEKAFAEKENPLAALLAPLDTAGAKGFVGLDMRGGYELLPTVEGADRVDVKELPGHLWDAASSAILFGYRYDKPGARITLGLAKHADVDVLVAMCDVCEAATTITADGKTVTKLMFVMRNNLKQSLVLKLPEGAQLWSSLVDDRPVTPSKNAKGEILVPLKKSESVDIDDEDSYRAKREQRRRAGNDRAMMQDKVRKMDEDRQATDLKPYDVEIVYVMPAIKLEDKGEIKAALPQVDVPIGQLGWAILLPANFRVVDTAGNVAEVANFSLPFVHFADLARGEVSKQLAQAMEKMQKAADAAKQSLQDQSAMAPGVLPVRVEIPLTGTIHRFEKLLTVNEVPAVTLTYRKKAE